ncbi:MAG: enoyl-CoA hydratase-related protein, partial [Acidimicrobiales bacterium]
LSKEMDAIEADETVHSIVVTGSDGSFCAGADLSALGSTDENLRRIYDGFLRIAQSPLPTIAAVDGPAVGAGLNLALACDVRLATRRSRFITRFLELGLHPGGGHTWMLARAVGQQTAAAMLLFGEELDGMQAEQAGLVLLCFDDDSAMQSYAAKIGAKAAGAPRPVVERTTATLRNTTSGTRYEAVVHELEQQLWTLRQPWFQERLEKLKSQVSGR